MIDTMHKLASKVYPVRFILVLFGVICAFAFLFITFSGEANLDTYLFPCVVAFGWSMCLYGISHAFHNVPSKINANDRFFMRIKKRVKRFFVWLISIGFLITTLILVYLSYKAFSMAS